MILFTPTYDQDFPLRSGCRSLAVNGHLISSTPFSECQSHWTIPPGLAPRLGVEGSSSVLHLCS